VSIDSAGVPHGGRYGKPDWFARELEKKGLMLCWSRPFRCFSLVRRRGGRWTFLRHLVKGGIGSAPWRLDRRALWLILYMWNRFGEEITSAVQAMTDRVRRDEVRRKYHDTQERIEAMRKPTIEAWRYDTGRQAPKILSLPRGLVRVGAKA